MTGGGGDEGEGVGQHYAHSSENAFPILLDERGYYVPTARDEVGNKRPRAPHLTGHSYPAKWSADLDESERPETDLEIVQKIARLTEYELEAAGWELPEGGDSTMSVGAILPADRPPVAERVALIDWDDVRDPETGAIHPVCAEYLHQYPGYADISVSGTGIHQLVLGGFGEHGGKFIAYIDDEPAFEGLDTGDGKDDWPQVEIYDGGRHVHMSGNLVDGSQNEIRDGQDIIDELLERFEETATAHPNGFTTVVTETKDDGTTVEREVQIEAEYTGPDPDEWDIPDDRCLEYHAAVEAHYHGYSTGNFWRVTGAAAAWGNKLGKSVQEVLDDLLGVDRPGVSAGYGGKTEGRVQYDWQRAESGAFKAPSRPTLAKMGVLPAEYVHDQSSADDAEHTAVLPPAVQDLTTTTSGWDWRHAGKHGSGAATLTVEDARERTTDAIADAYERGDRVLIEALPTMGKSYGAIKAAADTGHQVTVLTGRGHKEQYDQFREWCEEHDLDYYTLPSFTRDCSTANSEHGNEWKATVRDWYARGATPQEIHASADYVLDESLPCQEHEGHRCPYASKWDFEPADYDVLIGHYNHAYKSKVTAGRTVVFDEFPDAYETQLGPALQGAVSYWLNCTDGVPFDSYTDLIEHRDDQQRRADALVWFDEHGVEPDETHVFDDTNAHADAPLAVFTLLASDDLGNGFERATLDASDGVGGRGVFNRTNGVVSILRPPTAALSYASGVVALDGTPTKRLWELALGCRLNHRPVLQDEERAEYIRDALNLKIVRTSEYVKPYNSAGHVNIERDAALLEAIADQHGQRPSVITTATAEDEYDADGVLDLVDETKHYGNVLGSNEFDDTRLGTVIGSKHYGDGYIKKWGAYAGEAVERGEERGADLSYSGFGDDVLQHMREHDTLQAVMRFGRDGNGAVVYVHTDTLPTFTPIAGEARVLTTWSNGMKDVVRALEDLDTATTAAIVEHPTVDLSRQQVFAHLETLRERDVLTRQQDETDGRRMVWLDDGIHRLGEHGDVEIEPIELADLDDNEVRQLARSTLYTWEFTNLGGETVAPTGQSSAMVSDRARSTSNEGDPTSHSSHTAPTTGVMRDE